MRKAIQIALMLSGIVYARVALAQSTSSANPGSVRQLATTQNSGPLHLDLHQAEAIALQHHPQLLSAQLAAAAAGEVPTQLRSAYYPTVTGNFTGVLAESDSRIDAGALNNPIIYNRYSNGLEVNQLVTDFGRTHNLVASSKMQAQAAQAGAQVSRADVLLGVDSAYFESLRAQSVLKVAEQTVKERQVVVDQVTAMTANKLKSGLDLSFAQVNLSEAQLLLTKAKNDLQASYASLSTALGYTDQLDFQLEDVSIDAAPLPQVYQAVDEAFANRPELAQQLNTVQAAQRFASAEHDLYLPSLSMIGEAGLTPYRQDVLADRYAAAGFNLSLPIFEGHLFGARVAEAKYRAQSENEALRDLKNRIGRDVRQEWLAADTALQDLSLTAQLLAQADKALDLAQQRYNLGLSSIVELSQAQLNDAEAQIQDVSAKYDYEKELSRLRYQEGLLR